MSRAKWLVIFFVALGMAVPSFAVELSLGGFPSYMRTRARFLKNATFVNTLSQAQADALGLEDNDDEFFLVDTTLRLTPQLVLSDAVTIRAQVDVARNMIWGGNTDGFFQDRDSVVLSDLRPDDSFNGAILYGPKAIDDDFNFFSVRMLHADIVLPNGLGFLRIGRQPFDWGIGILANGGWDPHSDLGFVLDRFLWLKSWGAGDGNVTLVLVSDVFNNGNSPFSGQGRGYDVLAAALIYNQQMGGINVTIGGYAFPYLHQNNILNSAVGFELDVDRAGLYSGLLDLKSDSWRFVYEIQALEGSFEDGFLGSPGPDIDLHFDMVARIELYPSFPFKVIGLEGGWAMGDDATTSDFEGNLLPISPAYNLDNLLFKHMIPTIYNLDASVINAYYARAWATLKLSDHWSWTPQGLIAWNHETDAVSFFDSGAFGTGIPATSVDDFLGVEVESTLTWTVHPGVNMDFIGSVVFAGSGLTDLIEAQGEALAGGGVANAEDLPWAAQVRLVIFIDQFLK